MVLRSDRGVTRVRRIDMVGTRQHRRHVTSGEGRTSMVDDKGVIGGDKTSMLDDKGSHKGEDVDGAIGGTEGGLSETM